MDLMQTTIFYLGVLLVCLYFCYLASKKNRKVILIIPIAILSLVAGLRSVNTGIDTYSNYLGAEYYYKGGDVFNASMYAPGYGMFVTVIYKLCHDYNFLLCIEALITISLIVLRFWDFRKKASFTFMIFIFLTAWFIDMLTLKVQFIALAIAFFGTRYLETNSKKDFVKYTALTLLATSFHISAFVSFLILPLYKIRISKMTKKKLLVFILVTVFIILMVVLAKDLLLDRYMKYYDKRESHFGLMNIARLAVLLSTLFFGKQLSKEPSFKTVFRVALVGLLLNFVGYFIGNAGRSVMYLTIFTCVVYGMAQKDKRIDVLYKVALVLLIVGYEVYVVANGNIAGGYLYNFCF